MTADTEAGAAGVPEPTSETRSTSAHPAEPPVEEPSPGARQDSGHVEQPGAGAPAAPATGFEAAGALPQVLKIVGSVVAPTTLITALMFYFGLLYAVGYFRYFGVNYTVLDLPTQDYLILSADGAIIPLVLLAGASLLCLWLYQLPLERLSGTARRITRWVLAPSVAVAGAVLVGLAGADALFGAPVFPANFWEARGLSLSIGVLLLAYAVRMRRVLTTGRHTVQARRRVPEALVVAKWAGIFVLVSVGLFWAVGSYAIGVGTGGAQGLAADLACAPDVVLYSEKSLNMRVPGVQEEPAPGSDMAYGFRYTGLKLVPQSGSHYLFLPTGWSPATPAVLLPRSEALRLEFVSLGENRPATC